MGVNVHSLDLQFRWPLCRVWTQNLQTSLQFGCIKNFLLEKKQLHPTKRGNFGPVGCDYLDTGHYGMFWTCEDNFCQRVFYGPNFAQWGVFPVHVIFLRWRNTTKSLSKIWQYLSLLKTTIVATLYNNLSCKLKVMAQYLSQCTHMWLHWLLLGTCEYIDWNA